MEIIAVNNRGSDDPYVFSYVYVDTYRASHSIPRNGHFFHMEFSNTFLTIVIFKLLLIYRLINIATIEVIHVFTFEPCIHVK